MKLDATQFRQLMKSKFIQREDFEKMDEWLRKVVKADYDENKTEKTLITNHAFSPWMSIRVVYTEDVLLADKASKPPPYITAALFSIKEYWLRGPIIPEIESVFLSDDNPDYVKGILEKMHSRSLLYQKIWPMIRKSDIPIEKRVKDSILLLERETGHLMTLDPAVPNDLDFWQRVAAEFIVEGREDFAIGVFEALLNRIESLQEDGHQYNTSDILTSLGILQFIHKEHKKSKNNLLKALIQKIVSEDNPESSSPFKALSAFFNFSGAHYAEIKNQIQQKEDIDFENIVKSFKTVETSIAFQVFLDNIVDLDKEQLKQQLTDSQNFSFSDYKRGNIFEQMGRDLIGAVQGFDVSRKVTATGEIDGVVTNHRTDHPFFIELGTHFLMEAKNVKKTVSAPQVRGFVSKLREHRCRFGIIISTNGVSGPDMKNALALIRTSFDQDGTVVIVLDKNDLEEIVECKNIVSIIISNHEKLKFRQ